MKPPRPRRDPARSIVPSIPRTKSVEEEIRRLSNRVRILLELLPVCRLADKGGRLPPSPSRSAKA
jgi:hypothetical protein